MCSFAVPLFLFIFSIPMIILILPLAIGTYIIFLCFFLLYSLWLRYDWMSPYRGGYPSKFLRNCRIHRWFCAYFPIKYHLTEELTPDKNYLIAMHPHGIVGISAHNFIANGTGLMSRLPHINFHLCTLKQNFYVPIWREMFLLHGIINCSKRSLRYVLNECGKGQATVVVVGGAEEALDARPGSFTLCLRHRKGFVRIALETGAQLVPCFAFGENDLFSQPDTEGTHIRVVQTWIKDLIGLSLVLCHGRGLFNRYFGFIPYKRPLNTVIGAPITVQKTVRPTNEEVNELHALYIQRLTELFEENKRKYGISEEEKLVIR